MRSSQAGGAWGRIRVQAQQPSSTLFAQRRFDSANDRVVFTLPAPLRAGEVASLYVEFSGALGEWMSGSRSRGVCGPCGCDSTRCRCCCVVTGSNMLGLYRSSYYDETGAEVNIVGKQSCPAAHRVLCEQPAPSSRPRRPRRHAVRSYLCAPGLSLL